MKLNESQLLLAELTAEQNGRCFWCDGLIALIFERELTIVRQTQHEVGVLRHGGVTIYGIASVDHVVPRWLGGDKRRTNVVAACRQCNEDRGHLHNSRSLDCTGFDGWFKRLHRRPTKVYDEKPCVTNLGDILRKAL